jgi:hypothetical protein
MISTPHMKAAGGQPVPGLEVLNEVLGICQSAGIASETGPFSSGKGSEVTYNEYANASCQYLLHDRQFVFL